MFSVQRASVIWINLLTLALCSLPVSASSIRKEFETISNLGKSSYPTSVKSQKISNVYKSEISPLIKEKVLAEYTSENLDLLYQAVDTAEFYTQNPDYLSDMEYLIKYQKKRAEIKTVKYVDLYGSYIALREFKKASDLRSLHPEINLKSPPETSGVISGAEYSVFSVDLSGNKIKQKKIDIKGSIVVVVSHPTCHFSQNARGYLDSDPKLSEIFEKHSLWLVPPDRDMPTDLVAQWNEQHPNAEMVFAYSRKSWPILKDWETPVFYFMKDGVLIDIVVGWPKEGNAEAIRKGLAKINLL